MSRLVIVVEKLSDWGSYHPSENVVVASEYLKQAVGGDDGHGRSSGISFWNGARMTFKRAASQSMLPLSQLSPHGSQAK